MKNAKTNIYCFVINDEGYDHSLYFVDDRIECTNIETGELILTFDYRGNVFDKNKKSIGRFSVNDYIWSFEKDDGTVLEKTSHDLLRFEAEISILYIKGEL
jgi:hypothetical protein